MSNPLPMRKELMQCQNCWKSKTPGVTMSRCSACKIETYCGVECQRAAWPLHKAKCKINSRVGTTLPEDAAKKVERTRKMLVAFVGKHRPALAEAGLRALDLRRYPRNLEQKYLCVTVRQRPGKQPAQLLYVFEDAYVAEIDDLSPSLAADMRSVQADARRTGPANVVGTFFVMVFDLDTKVCNNVLVSPAKDVTYPSPKPYKEFLMHHINNGITI